MIEFTEKEIDFIHYLCSKERLCETPDKWTLERVAFKCRMAGGLAENIGVDSVSDKKNGYGKPMFNIDVDPRYLAGSLTEEEAKVVAAVLMRQFYVFSDSSGAGECTGIARHAIDRLKPHKGEWKLYKKGFLETVEKVFGKLCFLVPTSVDMDEVYFGDES